VGSANVKILNDIYHQQIMEGNIISTITKYIDKIDHFHAAGNPGRYELSIGELNYTQIFNAIDDTHFSGFIGLEYFPLKDAKEGLDDLLKNK
jgi:hydroxypyruvate isomerase